MQNLMTRSLASLRTATQSPYLLRFAANLNDLQAAQQLRFQVFNLELNEGLNSAYETGLDCDPFDAVCRHLLVERRSTGQIVGTYRMQTGVTAASALGYYCEQEFDFSPFEVHRGEILELGRACIHADHRNYSVLSMLWRGIAMFAQDNGARYLLGCSSLTSQSHADASAAYRQLQGHLAPKALRTHPLDAYACELTTTHSGSIKVPKLLSAYLALGAWICGAPAIDRTFKTIDFLTLMDLQSPEMAQRRKRFGIG
ncbi:GNAT family N-acetyltransferase [Rhodoferax sp. PAMC 29310]|uniref:GNAT family N-acetyltransferase n=1 Tax=Rhodoferax sp. PAMC 29310 TaxID=2822760 RepID=UPI001B323A35|nr:GNAT family N-acetyltransferase [Rhodoferax sp. PAMC 29310]